MYIPYGRQWIDQDDIKAVTDVLESDFLTTGPKIEEFEQAVAAYVGADYAVAVSNGTAALHLSCLAAGLNVGDEVITTPITFAASANCALYCGAKPVFADIDPVTYNINPVEVERMVTARTKAIIPVHYTGQPCDMEALNKIALKYGLTVIEDGAHALGAEYRNKKIGAVSDMTTFSFHPVKHITTGEGGIIVTNSEEYYQKLKLLRTHGITREDVYMQENHGAWYYEQIALGYNYRITDFQAALGISQLKKLDFFLQRRRELAKRYDCAFAENEEIVLPKQSEISKSAWHLYMIQVPKEKRKALFDGLRSAGIGVNVHYIPVYMFPYYRQNGYQDTLCKNAEEYYERIISLPLFPGLKEEEQDYVIETVKKLLPDI